MVREVDYSRLEFLCKINTTFSVPWIFQELSGIKLTPVFNCFKKPKIDF